jgi:CheY-like chemotaxis protein
MNNWGMGKDKLRVIFAEDEKDVREALQMMMEVLGCEVFAARNGKEALQLIEQQPEADLLVTDLSMPVMRGDELAAKARELRPGLPIMMLTAFSGSARQPQVDLLMAKPPESIALFRHGMLSAIDLRSRAMHAAALAAASDCQGSPG